MRSRWIVAAAAVAAIGVAGPVVGQAAKKAPAKAAAQRDWSRAVAMTPEGGFRVGNPAAATKIVEYGSLTCGHCAHFAEEGYPQLLSKYVKSGKVSFEFRNYIRDPFDAAAALVSRCAGTKDYFAVTDAIFAGQQDWIGKLRALPPAERQQFATLTPAEGFPKIAAASGFQAYAAKGNVTPQQANACLVSKAGLDKLVAMKRTADQTYNIEYTPTFLINGKKVDASSWGQLEPLLGTPGG